MSTNYYRLLDDINYIGRWQLSRPYSNSIEINESYFTSSKPFLHKGVEIYINKQCGIPFDFTLSAFDVPILNEKTAEIFINHASDEIELISVEIENHSGYFYILNTLHLQDCLDERKSIYTKWSNEDGREDKIGDYRMVPRLKVNKNKILGRNIFRIKGWDVPIIISDVIKSALENNQTLGPVFTQVT